MTPPITPAYSPLARAVTWPLPSTRTPGMFSFSHLGHGAGAGAELKEGTFLGLGAEGDLEARRGSVFDPERL